MRPVSRKEPWIEPIFKFFSPLEREFPHSIEAFLLRAGQGRPDEVIFSRADSGVAGRRLDSHANGWAKKSGLTTPLISNAQQAVSSPLAGGDGYGMQY